MLDDIEWLEQALLRAAIAEGVTVLGTLKHAFKPSGVTILLLLAESHVSLHTYPEQRRAFFDAFTCGRDTEPGNILRAFSDSALLGVCEFTSVERGSSDGHGHLIRALQCIDVPGHDVGPPRADK